jgi:hypothetical protein
MATECMYERQQFSFRIVNMDMESVLNALRTQGKDDDSTSKDMERHHNPEI